MKIEELIKLGIAEDTAKKIVELSDAELAAEIQKTTDKQAELKTAKESLKDLSEKVKAFDGVDVNKLKADLEDAQKKYDSDIASLKLDNAVSLALGSSGALDSDIVKSLIDKSIVKLDDNGKLVGFNEQLEKIKVDKAFLFGAKDEVSKGMTTTGMKVTTSSKAVADTENATLGSALAEHYNV